MTIYQQFAAQFSKRKSVRGFRSDPIPDAELNDLFELAQRAPSWCNIQPWRIWLTAPAATQRITKALVSAATTSQPHPDIPWPLEYPEPYGELRRACGYTLYNAMGIARDDKPARYGAWLRNYEAFGAPHLAIVCHDTRLGPYASLDVGVWLGVLITIAQMKGLALCPMASIAAYPATLRQELEIPGNLAVLFAVALGYEDTAAPVNQALTSRNPLNENLRLVAT